MTTKELKKLNRAQLLEVLIDEMEENAKLRSNLEAARTELENRRIELSSCGSLAEAALKINDVFSAADAAAEEYLANLRKAAQPAGVLPQTKEEADLLISTRQECDELRARTAQECEKMLAATRQKSDKMLQQTQQKCDEMVAHFTQESKEIYRKAAVLWQQVSQAKHNADKS